MRSTALTVAGIPAILWGAPTGKGYIHVHGKLSRKEYAETFAAIAERKGYQTLSFDLPEHGERAENHEYRCDIWNGMRDLSLIADDAFSRWDEVSLFACSLGAYFSLNAYADRPLAKCLFQSPILDMESLIRRMFSWFDVTEARLREEREIATPIDPLRWDYYQYVLEHPIRKWEVPTAILYGGRDNLQDLATMRDFAGRHGCRLTVAENSEHPFMAPEDAEIVARWLWANV